MLRAVRFAAQLDFELHKSVREAIAECSEFLMHVSRDAVRSEFEKIIVTENTGKGLHLLANLNLMKYIDVYKRQVSHIVKSTIFLEHLNKFWVLIRWPAAMTLYFLMVSFNYYILPLERVKFRRILPGSILASVGMLIVTGGFSVYIENIANYDIVYGSLASIVALLFWFYLLSWTLGLGIIFNRAWDETKGIV